MPVCAHINVLFLQALYLINHEKWTPSKFSCYIIMVDKVASDYYWGIGVFLPGHLAVCAVMETLDPFPCALAPNILIV